MARLNEVMRVVIYLAASLQNGGFFSLPHKNRRQGGVSTCQRTPKLANPASTRSQQEANPTSPLSPGRLLLSDTPLRLPASGCGSLQLCLSVTQFVPQLALWALGFCICVEHVRPLFFLSVSKQYCMRMTEAAFMPCMLDVV